MKFVSWNIDSINAAVQNSSDRGKMSWQTLEKIAAADVEIVAIQETKLRETGLTGPQQTALDKLFPGYFTYTTSSSARPSYAGTLMLAKHEPISVDYPKIGAPDDMDLEGRIITLEYPDYYVSTVYTPNSGSNLDRLAYRGQWDDAYRAYINQLNEKKPVIFSGDMNVAHEPIDLKHPESNHHNAGFTDQEREKFTDLLAAGYVDTLRHQHPETPGIYTWWAQRSKTSKINNSGWRIDYYLVSQSLEDKVVDTSVVDTGERRDHAPLQLEINL
ncbi:exodeoxyribonuclease III [Leuconostocaceae bacterium ESL0723]|nr:exodeoxyribonuclease III [Lactobacillaceae bacterium L1_55_11]WEV54105.1 exodeoxyribonuclease III [Leuconostocaceae bacterium ESL0723]